MPPTADSPTALTDAGPSHPAGRPPPVRDPRADVVRGVAIFGVVYIHAVGLVDVGRPAVVGGGGFGWAVPVFVILAGFFAARPTRPGGEPPRSYASRVAGRSVRLWVPFVVWSGVYFVVNHGWRAGSVGHILSRDFAGYGWAGQYFFIILIQAAFLLPLILAARVGPGLVIGTTTALLVWSAAIDRVLPGWPTTTAGKLLDDRAVIFWVPDLLLGAWLGRRWAGRLRGLLDGRLAIAGTVAIVVVLAVLPSLIPTELAGPTPYQQPLLVALAPAMFIALAAVPDALQAAVARPVAVAGRYSLGVFCLNPLVVGLGSGRLACHVAGPAGWAVALTVPLLSAAVVVAVAVLLSVGLDRCGLSRLVR